MTEINKRIQTILHKFASTRVEFCNTTGINQYQLKQIFKTEREISYNHIYLICNAYPQLNTDWLITGKGKIINDLEKNSSDLLKINIKIIENKKITLNVLRNQEYHYRQIGLLLREKVEICQLNNQLSDELAFDFASYSFAKKLTSNIKTDAYKLYKLVHSEYSAKVSPERLNLVVAFHLAHKFYFTTIDKIQLI